MFLRTISAVLAALKLANLTDMSWFLVMTPYIIAFFYDVYLYYKAISEQKLLLERLKKAQEEMQDEKDE